VAQVILLAAIATLGVVDLADHGYSNMWAAGAVVLGVALVLAGGSIAARAAWDLRAGLTPFPRPIDAAPLVVSGAYRLVRHPIYSGIVLAAFGWGTATASPPAIGATVLLFLLFDGKSRREEAWLIAARPEYLDFRSRTKRFIPWVY